MSDSSLFIYSVVVSITAHLAVIAAVGGVYYSSGSDLGFSVIDVQIVAGGEESAVSGETKLERAQTLPNVKPSEPAKLLADAPKKVKRATVRPVQGGGGLAPSHGMALSGVNSAGHLKIIRAPLPEYPWAARLAGFEGSVDLSIVVGSEGRVTNAEIAKSSGRSDCDLVALETVSRSWIFEAVSGGTPAVSAKQKVSVRYVLQ